MIVDNISVIRSGDDTFVPTRHPHVDNTHLGPLEVAQVRCFHVGQVSNVFVQRSTLTAMQAEPIIVDTPTDVQQHCNIEGNDILYALLIPHPSMLGLYGLLRTLSFDEIL